MLARDEGVKHQSSTTEAKRMRDMDKGRQLSGQ